MKPALKSFWRLLRAYMFYPVMITLFMWLFFTGAHWIFGLTIIVAILILDPMWKLIAQNIVRMVRRR